MTSHVYIIQSDVGGGDMQQMSYILDSVTSFRDKVRDFSLGGVVANATGKYSHGEIQL